MVATQPEAVTEPSENVRNALWWLLLITLGALALRLYRLGERPFWLDEAYSLQITDQPVADIWSWASPAAPVDPPLYFLALRGWRDLFGDSEAAVRSLSVVFGVALVPSAYWLGVEVRSRMTGLLAAGLVALAALQLEYAQMARMYCLLALAVTVASAATVRLARMQSGRWWTWVALVAGSAAALLTHFYGLFYFAGLAAAMVWINRRTLWSPFMRRWWIAQGAVLLLWATWIPAIPGQFQAYRRLAPGAFEDPHPLGVARTLFETVSTGVANVLRMTPIPQALTAALGLVLAWVVVRGIRRMTPTPRLVVLWELGIGVAIPVLLTLLVGPLVLGRTLVPAGVLVMVLLAAGAMTWQGTRRTAAAVGLVVLMAVGAASYSILTDNHAWDEAAKLVQEQAAAGDVVVFIFADGILPFDLYYDQTPNGPTVLPVADADISELPELTEGAGKVFLVRSHFQIHDPEGAAPVILGDVRPQEQFLDLTGIDLYVFGPEG